MFSRRVVGWAIDERITQQLTLNALRMAIATRHPLPGLLHHSDRGSQGRFRQSSQHRWIGGCDEEAQATFGPGWSGVTVLTWSPDGGRAE
jgi:hypothetical protein